ncbi:MAG: hypothetical protein AB1414_19795 [bacterium]
MEICCFPQSISTYFCFATFFEFYKFQSISITRYSSFFKIKWFILF